MLIKSLSKEPLERMRGHFNRLYGRRQADRCIERLVTMIGRYGVGYGVAPTEKTWDETTAVLITYADTVCQAGKPPLATLQHFSSTHLENLFSTIHILPFYPWSSDDGFSVIDYRRVKNSYGTWKHIKELNRHFELMFDLVLNHVSSQSSWFKNYVSEIAPYRDYFIEADPETDLSAVVRPRSLPLLTEFPVDGKTKHLWTTFSKDQIDVNFANPDVLFEFFDILLLYIANGAKIIRLDAIAYLWKQPGTSCIHLEQTHEVVKLMRDLLDMIAPGVIILTETNVPHDENISYFGNGDEARMVYNFSLPPLLLHALHNGTSRYLTPWAKSISETPDGCTWFNFTASHDGIGVRPLTGLVPESELTALVDKVKELGGQVSTKRNADGTDSPYELNITYFDALGDDEHQIDRFLCSQTVMLGLKGVPAVYFHSLTATPNDQDGVQATGRARSINRKKWNLEELDAELHKTGPAKKVFKEYRRRIAIRRKHGSFHPDAAQRVIDLDEDLFCFVRSADGHRPVICISSFSGEWKEVHLDERIAELDTPDPCTDLLSGKRYNGAGKVLTLDPYQTVWLTAG
ncbi:sugar phosphorylase [Tichowtungia aerotolerans]|uniref:Alpha-amylase n=1 Tax=Tichowtungia aerotolerans TaxID=2697043 RepID=A0A6P1MCG6_9BACT|nr:sugar phosphorylase [Tichowtungia aerotolerans]QHI69296.1 alpha-amylase [Tichowtungia aerotolerans]